MDQTIKQTSTTSNPPTLYLRVGTKFYKRIVVPDIHRRLVSMIVPWKVNTIKQDYGSLENIQYEKYDRFAVEEKDSCPSNIFNLRGYTTRLVVVPGKKKKEKVYYPKNESFEILEM
jgi:hypothetical protein